jgi:ATP-dependent DNA ligase
LAERRTALRDLPIPSGGPLLAPPPLAGDPVDCLAAVAREALPGLLLRRRDSAYLPGVRSRLWLLARPEARLEVPPPRRPILAVLQRLPLGSDSPEGE